MPDRRSAATLHRLGSDPCFTLLVDLRLLVRARRLRFMSVDALADLSSALPARIRIVGTDPVRLAPVETWCIEVGALMKAL